MRTYPLGFILPLLLVPNAAHAWNLAQVWFQQNYFPDGGVYTFISSLFGNVTVSFSMPADFASIVSVGRS